MAKKELATQPSSEALEALRAQFPQEEGFERTIFPRLGFKSQDVMEGKGKNMKVVVEAGTFFDERPTDEINEETGNNVWGKTEIGKELEGVVIYRRRQLSMYENEEYTSSPIYETKEDIVPIFCNKKEIARGTEEELKKKYDLKNNVILYVVRDINAEEPEVMQLNLRGTSMYAYNDYARKNIVPSLLTAFGSEECEKGSTQWNKITYTPVRNLSADEVNTVLSLITDIRGGIAAQQEYFASLDTKKDDSKDEEDF